VDKILGLGLGSLAGGLSRVSVGALAARFLPEDFPYGTLIVNLTACLLIGLLDELAEEKFLMSPAMRLTLVAGFCGAYSTFSTLLLETNNLLRDGDHTRAFLNIAGSVTLGLLALRAGIALGRAL
jgi:CrcB protein